MTAKRNASASVARPGPNAPAPEARLEEAEGLQAAGRLDAAEALLRDLVAARPDLAAAWRMLGMGLAVVGRLAEAVDALASGARALPPDPPPDAATLLCDLGALELRLGRVEAARLHLARALRCDPENPQALNNMGDLLRQRGEQVAALAHFNKAARFDPGGAEPWNNRGLLYRDQGRLDEAARQFGRAAELAPDVAVIHRNLADLELFRGRIREAARALEKAALLECNDPEILLLLARCNHAQGAVAEAVEQFRIALGMGVAAEGATGARLWEDIAHALREDQRHDAAATAFEHAAGLRDAAAKTDGDAGADPAVLDPEILRLRALAATTRREAGALVAVERLRGALLEAREPEARLMFEAGRLSDFAFDGEEIARLRRCLAGGGFDRTETPLLAYTIAMVADSVGDTPNAFANLARANQAMAKQRGGAGAPGDEQAACAAMAALFETRPDAGAAAEGSAQNHAALPVFLVGMPRAGLAVVEHVLASHSGIEGAGPLRDIPALLEAEDPSGSWSPHPGMADPKHLRRLAATYIARRRRRWPLAQRVIDRTPLNYRFVGPLALAFPRATIIHVRRHSLDTCLSIYRNAFTEQWPFAFSLDRLAETYGQYLALMRHWHATMPGRIVEVAYETLCANPEVETRRLIDALGLPWEEACAAPEDNARVIRGPSCAHLRRPLITERIGRWQAYRDFLRPLVEVLGLEALR